MIKLSSDTDNVFSKIQQLNKWVELFPNNEELKKKIKLSTELLDQIFKDFHFKDLKKNSGAHCILKHIYKAYFKKDLLITIIDKHNNSKHTINEDIINMFQFGIENLRAYTIQQMTNNNIDMFNDDEEDNKNISILDTGIIFD